MLNRRNQSAQRGFSLVEMLVAVAILGILASVALPSFRIWLQNSQIRNAAESITNGLQRARAEAVQRNINVEFVLSADSNSSWKIKVAGLGGAEIESRLNSEGSRNVSVNTDASNTVTYNNFGRIVANVDGSAPFRQVNVDSNILSAADSQDLRITIGVGGNVRMCDPNAPTGTTRACN